MNGRNVYIVAGPNGSGKTTFARTFLPVYARCENFINTDLIAQGLSPFKPGSAAISAGKIVLRMIAEFAARGDDFAFETTLSGRTYLNLLRDLREKGYSVHLFFLWISSPELAIARVRGRVAEGGHAVPEEDVRRRFRRSIANFFGPYRPLLNSWLLFDNGGARPRLIARGKNGLLDVIEAGAFAGIRKSGGLG